MHISIPVGAGWTAIVVAIVVIADKHPHFAHLVHAALRALVG